MSYDPALQAHEHREHAEHAAHAQDRFISTVSITIAILAVLASFAGSLETVEAGRAITASSAAVLKQDQATDAWAEYQADSIKKNLFNFAAASARDPKLAADFVAQAKREAAKQDKVRTRAMVGEAGRDSLAKESARHEERHHWLTAAATLIEIGIALSTVAIITRRRSFWLGAIGLGAIGCSLFAVAYLSAGQL